MPFHGVDTRENTTGPTSVVQVPSGLAAIVGIAPKGPVNQLILVKNLSEAAQFGAQVPGFDIPKALSHFFAEGGKEIMVINVYDPATMVTSVPSESITLAGGKGRTAFVPISNLIVKHTSGTPVYAKDTDYTVDEFGFITSINNTTIAQNASIQVSYNRFNAAAVTSVEIIGTVNSTTGARTGFKALENSFNLYTKEPKILLSGFSTLPAVVAEMRFWADRFFGVGIVDAPTGTTVSVAVAGRGPAGAINFNVADENIILAFPELLALDPYQTKVNGADTYVARQFAPILAGVGSRVDADTQSFHNSWSSHEIRSATGTAVNVTSSAVNPGTDAQTLNDAGIVTVYNEGSSGLKVFGNRSSGYPASSRPTTFYSVRRTADLMVRSMQLSAIQFLDKPMNQPVRDAILETLSGYVRGKIAENALIDGSVYYNPDNNPTSELALGHWLFNFDFMPAIPGERITLSYFVDITLLSKLNS